MRMNGTIVYRISIGMLYRTCGGSLSPRLRWKTTAHRISPHTTTPTASPAIHEPCQRLSVILPWVVMGFGKPRRVNVSFVQPVRASSMTASTPTRITCRRFRVNEAPSQQGRPAPAQGPVRGLLQRVVETVSRSPAAAHATPRRYAPYRPFLTEGFRPAPLRIPWRNGP